MKNRSNSILTLLFAKSFREYSQMGRPRILPGGFFFISQKKKVIWISKIAKPTPPNAEIGRGGG